MHKTEVMRCVQKMSLKNVKLCTLVLSQNKKIKKNQEQVGEYIQSSFCSEIANYQNTFNVSVSLHQSEPLRIALAA